MNNQTNSEAQNHRFDFTQSKAGLVTISSNGKAAKSLKGKDAARFLNKIESCDAEQAQLLMAKATGQFKFGNEKLAKEASNRDSENQSD